MRTSLLIAAIAAASFALLGREALPDGWSLPLAARIVLLVGLATALGLLVRGRIASRERTLVASVLLLLGCVAALSGWPRRPDPEAWRQAEDTRLRARHATVQRTMLELETHARAVGTRALALLASHPLEAPTVKQRTELFAALRQALDAEQPPAMAVTGYRATGVQIVDQHDDLIAWAGTPHSLDAGTRVAQLAGPRHSVGFRRSGVYTLLTVEATPDSAGDRGMRAVVDVPVEVSYQLSNRFLQSRSLAADLSGGGVEVEFSYEESSLPPHLARSDLDIHGDESHWRRAESALRDASGAPLVICRLDGLPYDARLERREERAAIVSRWLLALASAAGAITVLGIVRARRIAWLGFPGRTSPRSGVCACCWRRSDCRRAASRAAS